jgi:DNA-binding CsgD family transcriptional regulator
MELLSNTEKEIIEMRVSGLSRKQIADKTFRSELTIKTHFQNMIKKTNSKDEIDLVVWFLKTEKVIVIAMIAILLITYSGIDFIELLRKLSGTIQSCIHNGK